MPDPHGRTASPERSLRVVQPGPLTTVQDLGRPGWAHLGVPRSGAADQVAHRLANRLVGNPEHVASLEITVGGLVVALECAVAIALTGARGSLRVNGRPREWGTALSLAAGDLVEIGPFESGLRGYLAFSGGVDCPTVLGSRSTDLLSGLGPAPLGEGQELRLGSAWGPPMEGTATQAPARDVVRLVPGPRADWFRASALGRLGSSAYVVEADSNRIAVRLSGPKLNRIDEAQLPSEGLVLGSVQVPPNGQPLVMLADHPVTGGYPVIGVVPAQDLALLAQARPGEPIRFSVVAGAEGATTGRR